MAKRTHAHSRQSSAIHLLREHGASTNLNPGVAGSLLAKRSTQEKSGTAMHDLNVATRPDAWKEGKISRGPNPATVLKELFELLEDYAPVWYTEETHHRAVAALAQSMQGYVR